MAVEDPDDGFWGWEKDDGGKGKRELDWVMMVENLHLAISLSSTRYPFAFQLLLVSCVRFGNIVHISIRESSCLVLFVVVYVRV